MEMPVYRWGQQGKGRDLLLIWAFWLPKGKRKTTKFFLTFYWSISSVQFSCAVVSDSLRPHELQHARPPCPSPTPGAHSNSCASSWWCHPAVSSSVIPFSSCPQSLPTSESFPMSQLFPWGGQSTGVSALASFLPKLQIHTTFLILQAFIECKTPDPMPTDGDKKQTKYTGKL